MRLRVLQATREDDEKRGGDNFDPTFTALPSMRKNLIEVVKK